ncbi:MAG TPA: hypothetical protein DGB72_00135, partial [Gemmatimonadetes bacterium]|nr:hypothetical protein [Gemmatimonadota bacterium]
FVLLAFRKTNPDGDRVNRTALVTFPAAIVACGGAYSATTGPTGTVPNVPTATKQAKWELV